MYGKDPVSIIICQKIEENRKEKDGDPTMTRMMKKEKWTTHN